MTAGFALGVGVLAFNGSWSPRQTAFAEDKPIVVPASLFEMQNTFRSIAKNVLPGVVEIKTEADVVNNQLSPISPNQQPFDFFFGPNAPGTPDATPPTPDTKTPKAPKTPRTQKSEGLGSGIMVERQGDKVFILTNNHVVDAATKIIVKLSDQREYDATLVGVDIRRDLAMVSITTKETDLTLVKLGDSSELQVGDWVLAIGNPLGLEFTVTSGIVSALGRQGGPDDSVNINNYIQTDASINRGNSGGALVNLKGELVGINTWIASPNGASVGLGFAIPVNNAKKPITDFISKGTVQYGWLGASVTDLSKEVLKDMRIPGSKGSFIPHVFRGSPADKSGILPGDFVTAINGKDLADTNALVQTVGDLAAGSKAEFTLVRDGATVKKTVTIDPRPKEADVKTMKLWPGFVVSVLTPELRDQLDIAPAAEGLLVSQVEIRSTADIAGLKAGDLLKAINGKTLASVSDFYRALNEKASEIKLNFVREGVELSIGVSR
jgi:Do/DeqQ family serine protease